MNLLFLSSSRFANKPYNDPSTRYRCYHFAEDLKQLGYLADVAHIDTIRLSDLDRYQVIVVSRPSASTKLEKLLEHCERMRILAVADFDDLIFDPNYTSQMPQVVNDQAITRHVESRLNKHHRALTLFKYVSVSTTPLVQHVTSLVSNEVQVICLPNGLSSHWLRYNQHRQKVSNGANNIAYLSGSSSHDHDFAEILPALKAHLAVHTSDRLEVTGKLSFSHRCFDSRQIHQNELLPYEHLPSVITNARVILAPLAVTAFNQCKSHIKFIEAAAFGVPVISSPIPDFRKHKITGLLFADNEQEWSESLKLAMEPDFRNSVAADLIDYAHQLCRNMSSTKQLIHFLNAATTEHNEYANPVSGYA